MTLIAIATGCDSEKSDQSPVQPVRVRASINKSEAQVGEALRLTELVSNNHQTEVYSLSHNVTCIGNYERSSRHLILRDSGEFLHLKTSTVFGTQLPDGVVSTRPIPFTVVNPREKGFEFEFTPRKIGVFLLHGIWFSEKSRMSTQPLVITVVAPLDEKGNSVIKEEWLLK